MSRTLPNSKVNPKKVRSDDAVNRAINRGNDNAEMLDTTQVDDQPVERFGGRFKGDTTGR